MPGPHHHMKVRPQRIGGILPGSLHHQILLALRGIGGLTTDQVYARFAYPSGPMCELRRAGLINTHGEAVTLTDAGARLVDPGGPLARSKTLISYCQL